MSEFNTNVLETSGYRMLTPILQMLQSHQDGPVLVIEDENGTPEAGVFIFPDQDMNKIDGEIPVEYVNFNEGDEGVFEIIGTVKKSAEASSAGNMRGVSRFLPTAAAFTSLLKIGK
ncbi:MAG: hypothetical protein HN337_06965 [Deltaproteobacteria bacterium]|jgi:hypothetical protein|nr:hypothetical protein [Deltaproteobacteria bacterium]